MGHGSPSAMELEAADRRRHEDLVTPAGASAASRLRGRWGRVTLAAGAAVLVVAAVAVLGRGGGWMDAHPRPGSKRMGWQALSSRGMQTSQLEGWSREESALIAQGMGSRGRDGDEEDGAEGGGGEGGDSAHEVADNVDELAYEQWFRAASMKKWFGKPDPNHVGMPTDKTKFVDRRDCAAAIEYNIENVAKDCKFPCGACEGHTFRAQCSLLHNGYCADCAGCPTDYYRIMCGGPRVDFNLEFDMAAIKSFADVINTKFNTSEVEGKCVPCSACPPGEYRIDCGDQSAGHCTACGQCDSGQYRDSCGFTNPGTCKDCEVCRAGEYIPDCAWINKGSCRACSTCSATEYMIADCSPTTDRECGPCADLPLCEEGYFREGCGFGSEGKCVPCRSTEPGFYRVECGPSSTAPPGFPLDGGHTVACAQCEAAHYRDGCTGLSEGQCVKCEDCGADNWREHCATPLWHAGQCQPCQDCGTDRFLTGCAYLEPGTCADCYTCSPEEYLVTDCTKTANRICAPCSSLPACPDGQYRQGCGSGSEGECTDCPVPPVGHYHVQCGGLSAGRDVRCGECAEGEFNYDCQGTSPGVCTACGACGAGEYRTECGTWISPGRCEPCQTCPSEHHLVGCQGMNAGSCVECYVCARDEYQTQACTNAQDRVCAKCSTLPECDAGHYRANCGLGSEGTCKQCGECPPGSFREGCGGDSPGTCSACGECPEGQYRYGCTWFSAGECRPCADCEGGSYRVGCMGESEGQCEPCVECAEHEYESRACSGTSPLHHNRQCLPCESLSCAPGQYRLGCGSGPQGECTLCPDKCPDEQFLVGCGGQEEGVCGPCALDCPEGQYRADCAYLNAGQCEACPVCPEGFVSKGCGGLHKGACISCDTIPCPAEGMERIHCGWLKKDGSWQKFGGTKEGKCVQKWLEDTPPPETILWGLHLTDNPTPDCIDNGGNDIPGVTRNFKITGSILRLAACSEGTATGRYQLKALGDWLISFYVGVPAFADKAPIAPAAYPLEDEGKPDPTDTLEVTINGYTQTFTNAIETKGDENKLVFYHRVANTMFVDFKFVWKSSNAVDHLHLFASTGTAAFMGDNLDNVQAKHHLLQGEGTLKGKVINAVDGMTLKPGMKVGAKSGYKDPNKGKVIRLYTKSDVEADVHLLVGSSDMVTVLPKDSKFSMQVVAGKYACQASLPGFYTTFDPTCEFKSNQELLHDMVLCPYLNPGHGRFILTWGEEPSDMDLYLDAPDGKGGRCTVMFQNKYCQDTGPRGGRLQSRIHLDHDVLRSYGPETLTVEGFLPGEYQLRVKHYRGWGCVDKRTNYDKCLAESGATVAFYMDIHQYRWEVGKHGYTHDIQWVIAKIDGATRQVTMCTPELCPPISDPGDNY